MTWIRELQAAARSLIRRPAFSGVIVLTLALGIAANVAIFTVVNGVLLRPLPFPEAERIVSVRHHAPGLDLPELENSPGTIRIYRDHARTLGSIAVVQSGSRNLSGGTRPDRVRVAAVSPPFFRVVGIAPALGRPFTEADAQPGAAPVVVLTHSAWVARYGGSAAALGSTLRIDGVPTEVIGVMPEGYRFPESETAALLPVHVPEQGALTDFGVRGIARLAGGASIEDARREVEALQQRLPEFDVGGDFTPAFMTQARWAVTVTPLRDRIVGDVRATLWIVLGTVGFLLLIACANVANLFLVRAEARQREVAIRAAVGASRGRLALMFLSESMLLGLVSGAIGLALATAGVRALVAYGPEQIPRLHEIGVGGTVAMFALAISVLAGLAFGALPVAHAGLRSVAGVLHDGGRTVTEGRRRHRVRDALVAGQLAMALVLLVGSGLMLRSYIRLASVDPGIDPASVTAVEISMGRVEDRAAAARFYRRIVDALRGAPGVAAVGASSSLPLRPVSLSGGSFSIESEPTPDGQLPPVAMWTVVSAGFFETLGIPLVRGRGIEMSDVTGPGRDVWVNRAFARAFLDDAALGERLRVGGEEGRWWTIAGVVGDVRHFQLNEPARPLIYFPVADSVPPSAELTSFAFVMKGPAPQAALVARVRDVVARVAPGVPVTRAASMDEIVAQSMATTSFTMALLAIAAVVALLLGTVGVYGVVAYAVSQRTREIGVRVALGATARDIRVMVLRHGLIVTLVGALAGLAAAYALTRLMASVLYEVSPTDPTTFALVAAGLALISLAASWLPALRASRVEPVTALSVE